MQESITTREPTESLINKIIQIIYDNNSNNDNENDNNNNNENFTIFNKILHFYC